MSRFDHVYYLFHEFLGRFSSFGIRFRRSPSCLLFVRLSPTQFVRISSTDLKVASDWQIAI